MVLVCNHSKVGSNDDTGRWSEGGESVKGWMCRFVTSCDFQKKGWGGSM